MTVLVLVAILPVGAAQACGLCATQVTTNSALAACFLERHPVYEGKQGVAVAIDLSDCPQERGVVEALSSPTAASAEPDLRFILSKPQLRCLKSRLETPDTALDPSATIRLDDCE